MLREELLRIMYIALMSDAQFHYVYGCIRHPARSVDVWDAQAHVLTTWDPYGMTRDSQVKTHICKNQYVA